VVFLGPTLNVEEARKYLDARYLPPVGQGDVVRCVHDIAPSVLVIIDGVFAQHPAVRHKELMWAMAAGISVYGSSSMGAIRAAELSEFGMRGFGLVYRWYRRTPLADDADVAVTMAPEKFGSSPLTASHIDVRLNLKRAERSGIISRETRAKLEEISRCLPFADRRYERIVEIAQRPSTNELLRELTDLRNWLNEYKPSQKKDDAIALLKHLSKIEVGRRKLTLDEFTLTDAWVLDLEHAGIAYTPPRKPVVDI
jgi:hypothetical protein